jgi:hypothetical protein
MDRTKPVQEGVRRLRLLLTPFPQQQFNETIDRRSESRAVESRA